MPPGVGSSSAFMPFQRVSFSGSTKNSQTVSGLAAIEIVRSSVVVSVVVSMLLPLLLLCLAFECFQPHVPELFEELLELVVAHEGQDLPPPGRGDRLQCGLHGQ